MNVLKPSALVLACLSGCLLLVAALVTIASIVARNFFEGSIDGDTELVAALSGVAVALFLPWCQLTKGNIIVDFFTTRASRGTHLKLDRFGAALLCIVMAALAYRTLLGSMSAWSSGAGSMILGIPDWIVQTSLIPGLLLTAAIAAFQALSRNELLEVQP